MDVYGYGGYGVYGLDGVQGLGRKLCKLGIALTALGMSGCFSAIAAYRDGQVCTPLAAERNGVDDASRGRRPQESYGERCGVAVASLNGIYREAYDGVPMAERTRTRLLDRILRRESPGDAEFTATAETR